MALLARILERLDHSGVSVTDLQQLAEDEGLHWESFVAAILLHKTEYRELVARHSEVSSTVSRNAINGLLRESSFSADEAGEYSTPERFAVLLSHVNGPHWHRAAIVMRFGLGTTRREYEIAEIAALLKLSESTVGAVVNPEGRSSSLGTARYYAELPPAEQDGSKQDLELLGLSTAVRNLLLRAEITTIDQLCGMTEQEVRTACFEANPRRPMGPKSTEELTEVLASKGRALKQ
jgi:hypothetical protein